MMKRALFLLVLVSVISCNKKQEIPDLEDLQVTLKIFNEAFEKGDVEKLDQLITENYSHTNGSWKAFGKKEWLEYMRKRRVRLENGELKLCIYRMEDLNIEMNQTSAYVTGRIVMEGVENNEPFERQIRVSNLWLIEGGKWKRAGFHDTRIE